MLAYFLFLQGVILAAVATLLPEQTPPGAWYGIWICIAAVPLMAWLEHMAKVDLNRHKPPADIEYLMSRPHPHGHHWE